MLKPPTTFSSLEGLLELDRHDGIDMRPTLLRVLTDLYLQKRTHPPEDERYYTELALRLIDATGQPALPIEHASALPMQANASAESEAVELCELFFAAGGPERRLILLSLDYSSITPSQPPSPMQRTDVWRLESAALQHNSEAVVRELERALGVSRNQARRIVQDELGEPVVVAAKAMSLPADVLQRMLLFVNPRVGQSVDRVYELATLYSEISVDAARRLIAIWRDAEQAVNGEVRHEASPWRAAAETARRALTDVSHRPAAPEQSRLRILATDDGARRTDKANTRAMP